MLRIAPFLLLCASLACKKPQPARFCDQDLTGLWFNSSDKHFAYRLQDDRTALVRGEFLERADDGGLKAPEEPISFELHRSQDKLAGVKRTKGPSPAGGVCPIEFDFHVSDCQPDAMQAVVEMSAPIGDDCKRKTTEDGGAIPPQLAEFRFERAFHRSVGGDGPVSH